MKTNTSANNLVRIIMTAMLSAIAFAFMFIEFPIPVMPPFIKLDISDFPALIGSFAFGPVSGVIIELLKNVLHIVIKGTQTACVGELSNFLLGCFFVIPAGLIYRKKGSFKYAVVASVVGSVVMGVLCLPVNYFVVYPAFVKFYGLPLEAIIGMYKEIFSGVNGLFDCLLIFNVPFTLCKGLIDAVVCIAVYKPLESVLFKKFFNKTDKNSVNA